MSETTTYRVYRLSEPLRSAVKAKRLAEDTTNEALILSAAETELPRLVAALQSLGFGAENRETKRPARLPLDGAVLASLQDAAETTGIPQSTLLALMLQAHCADAAQAAEPAKAPKATRRAAKTKPAAKTGSRAKTRGKARKAAPKAAASPKRRKETRATRRRTVIGGAA